MSLHRSLPINIANQVGEEETKYDTYHGGPYDRGGADSYYRRSPSPHYWPAGTGKGSRVEENMMTKEEIDAYWAGYNDNEQAGDFKEW
jgi:hypothetical protein